MAKPRRCKGKTKSGDRCTRLGAEYCAQHAAQASTDSTPKKRARASDWADAFFDALAREHTVWHAAEAAGIHRDTAYKRRDRDEAFAQRWADVIERDTELLEREAYRRAAVGTLKPVFQGGVQVGEVREYSDTLLIFMLKARRPEVYRERMEHTGAGGGPLEHRVRVDLSKLTDAQLDALEALHDGDEDGTVEG